MITFKQCSGNITATLVRKFGKYNGRKEIESIVVDNELGVVWWPAYRTGKIICYFIIFFYL
ncbi:hypothetical protein [Niabella aurantiaca]|uniref:hypothetical protein n=1 Tax=Niabella aurantiaca TaxID=379900 RepID=UPI0003767041|nr:hypothetical protein [Niabella aurantiaca]